MPPDVSTPSFQTWTRKPLPLEPGPGFVTGLRAQKTVGTSVWWTRRAQGLCWSTCPTPALSWELHPVLPNADHGFLRKRFLSRQLRVRKPVEEPRGLLSCLASVTARGLPRHPRFPPGRDSVHRRRRVHPFSEACPRRYTSLPDGARRTAATSRLNPAASGFPGNSSRVTGCPSDHLRAPRPTVPAWRSAARGPAARGPALPRPEGPGLPPSWLPRAFSGWGGFVGSHDKIHAPARAHPSYGSSASPQRSPGHARAPRPALAPAGPRLQ